MRTKNAEIVEKLYEKIVALGFNANVKSNYSNIAYYIFTNNFII